MLAKAHQHIARHVARQRRAFQHQAAAKLVTAYDRSASEEVQTANMVKTHPLAKRSSDAGWGRVLSPRTFKAVGAGKRVDVVAPADTRQAGSGCGVMVSNG